ncbi:MAG: Peptidoglycan-N-acetylmuramic acid deacetylase PdaC [Actinobacteria bacterium ADurb.Bin346]|nr:MAG: Peptidoglycan-N-acetylmuramic acid deacetylase PdaC [Actinobacteria bacterium ADurb.Bin346]
MALVFSGCSAVAGLFKKSLFSSPDAQSQAQGSKETSAMEGTKDDEGSEDKDKSQAEDEGNKSGKVPGEGGAVSFYDPDGGITLSFLPDTIELSSVQWMQEMDKNIIVSFSKADISSFSNDSISIAGYTKELAQQDIAKLKEGSFGPNVDFGYEPSQKVIKLNGTYAKDFLVLSRFEVCNVTFEREIIFYRGNFQYIINIMGIEDRIKNSVRQYFKTDSENCGDELVWDFDKQGQFYNALTGGTASEEAMEWYNASEDVVKSLAIAENGPEVLEGSLVISNKQTALNSTEKNYTITASYPELLISGQAGMLASINKEISDVVNEQVGTFKKDMESIDTAAEDTPEDWPVFVNTFRGDYSILLSHGNRFLSIPFIFYYFTGGAHGNSFNVMLNYDLKNYSKIELKNIFKPGFDYVSFISDYCIEDVKSQNRQMGFEPDEKWIKEGASANEENFRNFVLNDDELIIIFDPYEVAPYAAGSVFVKIPFDRFRENIDIF